MTFTTKMNCLPFLIQPFVHYTGGHLHLLCVRFFCICWIGLRISENNTKSETIFSVCRERHMYNS